MQGVAAVKGVAAVQGVAKHACEPSTSSTTLTIWVISAICAGAKAAAPLPRRSSSGEEAEAEVEVEVAARSRWYLRFSKARSALMRCSSSAATPGKGHACHIGEGHACRWGRGTPAM